MTDLVQAALNMGMSVEDIAILQSMPGRGVVDLQGVSGRMPTAAGPAVQELLNANAYSPVQGAMVSPYRDPTNYRTSPRGNVVGDGALSAAEMYGGMHNEFYDGLGPKARAVKAKAGRVVGRGARRMAGKAGRALGGLPGMSSLGTAAKVLGPALGAVGGAVAVGDVILGDESFANKAMDSTAMTIGGIIGSAGGPLGTAAGIGVGKMLSDGTQYIFGDKKSPEERRMEEALLALRGGVI